MPESAAGSLNRCRNYQSAKQREAERENSAPSRRWASNVSLERRRVPLAPLEQARDVTAIDQRDRTGHQEALPSNARTVPFGFSRVLPVERDPVTWDGDNA